MYFFSNKLRTILCLEGLRSAWISKYENVTMDRRKSNKLWYSYWISHKYEEVEWNFSCCLVLLVAQRDKSRFGSLRSENMSTSARFAPHDISTHTLYSQHTHCHFIHKMHKFQEFASISLKFHDIHLICRLITNSAQQIVAVHHHPITIFAL